jgi:hypothetical protein
MTRATLLIAGFLWAACAFAIDTTMLPDPVLQQRYEDLTHEFRCMQCQNNSIADSPVGLASDLRRDVKELLLAGKTDDEIRAYMVWTGMATSSCSGRRSRRAPRGCGSPRCSCSPVDCSSACASCAAAPPW